MGNKQVTDRRGSTELVVAAAETHAARIQEAFAASFGNHLAKKDGKAPDLGLAVVLLARALREASDALVRASDAYDAELADDAAPREARDSATAALNAELVGIRGTIEAVYGTLGLKALGIEGRTPVEPKAVFSQASKVAAALRDPKVKLPRATRKGVKVDREALAEELDAPLATLKASLGDVAREAREAQAASDAKAKAMAANDDLFGRAATFISAALELVGDDDLAARVRPVQRRPGTAAGAEAGDAGAGEGEGDAAEPAGGPGGK
jgi:hypothetical protein